MMDKTQNLKLSLIVFCCFQQHIHGTLVDLTHTYNDGKTPVPSKEFFDFNMTIMQRGYATLGGMQHWVEYNSFAMPEHLGTHMDAPQHVTFRKDMNWYMDEIPIDRFRCEAVIMDIRYKANMNTNRDAFLDMYDIHNWERKYGRIKPGSVLFVNSGWDQYWGDDAKYFGNKEGNDFHWPGIGEEAARWLVNKRQLYGVGTDTIGLGPGNVTTFVEHRIFLSQNIYGLENVKNLGKIPEHGATVYIFPMKVHEGSGGPVRIIAEFDTERQLYNCCVSVVLSLRLLLSLIVYTVYTVSSLQFELNC